MNCADVELSITSQDPLEGEAMRHLEHCESCRAFQASSALLLADAALPLPGAHEKAALNTLAPKLHQRFRQLERRRSFARRVVGLAMAACFGAAVASAALLPRGGLLTATHATVSDLPEVSFQVEPDSTDTSDELDSFEVSWPSIDEGVAP